MADRIVLCVKDPDRENEYRPLRMRDGRLLVRLVADPSTDDVGVPSRRTVLPTDEAVVLAAAEGEADEELQTVKGAGSIMELEIVDGLDGISGFMDHHERHEDGGADEIDVTDLSGKLADPQPVDVVGRSYAKRWAWLMLGAG